jgi:chemotaxis protein CheX
MAWQIEKIEQLTGEAVEEVFRSMLSMEVQAEAPAPLPDDPAGQMIGSVGFIGGTTGILCLFAGVGFARLLTSRMLGIPLSEVDEGDMLNDAVGELSNMVAGHVKSRLCDGDASCTLTIPSVVRGQQLRVEGPAQVTRRVLGFRHGQDHLLAEVLIKDSSAKKL